MVYTELDPEISAQVGATPERFDAGETLIPPLLVSINFINTDRLMYVTEPIDSAHTEALKRGLGDSIGKIPGMRSFATRGSIFSDNRGGTRSINVEISGRNLEQLFSTSLAILRRAETLFEGAQIRSTPPPPSLALSQPMAYIVPDWNRAAELRISQSELGYTLWAYSDGAFVDEFFLDDDKLDIYLYSAEGAVSQPADLEQLMLHTASGSLVPLSALARVEERVGASSIPRVNGLRTVTINIVPPREVALETGAARVRSELLQAMRAAGEIPDDISTQVAGATSKLEQTRAALPLFGLEPLTQPLDVITMLGFLILIGTVVNNPILLVDRTVKNIKQQGMAVADEVAEATRVRLRPVLMSTVTTLCGLSPLVFLPGAGTELYRGLGAIVLCGLLVSSAVTLLVLPALLRVVFDARTPALEKPVSG